MATDYGFEYECLEGTFYTCSVCRYAWRTRCSGNTPRSCPGCGTRLWKESFTHNCMKCGHEWITSRQSAKKCPSCQSAKWNGQEGETVCCNLAESDRDAILFRYHSGVGAVKISCDTGFTFSDVIDTILQDNPEAEVVL